MHAMRQFELLEDLSPGRSARAALLRWNGDKYVLSRESIELFDCVGTHGHKGDRGYAFQSPESNRWEAVAGLYEQVPQWLPS